MSPELLRPGNPGMQNFAWRWEPGNLGSFVGGAVTGLGDVGSPCLCGWDGDSWETAGARAFVGGTVAGLGTSGVRGRPFWGGTVAPGGRRESVPLWGLWEAVGVRWLSGVRAFVGTATRLGDTGAVGLRTSGEWL